MPPMATQGTSEGLDDSRDEIEEFAGRHPSVVHVLRLFRAGHLATGSLRELATLHRDLAYSVARKLPDGPELVAGLRKLREAADCHVRALVLAEQVDAPNRVAGQGGDMPAVPQRAPRGAEVLRQQRGGESE